MVADVRLLRAGCRAVTRMRDPLVSPLRSPVLFPYQSQTARTLPDFVFSSRSIAVPVRGLNGTDRILEILLPPQRLLAYVVYCTCNRSLACKTLICVEIIFLRVP